MTINLLRGVIVAMLMILAPGLALAQAPHSRAFKPAVPVIVSPSTAPIAEPLPHKAWADTVFEPPAQPRAFAGFAAHEDDAAWPASADNSMRAAIDAPLGAAQVSLRLTGIATPVAELAADRSLAPMSFFASSNLLGGSVLAGANLPAGSGRLTLFGASSLARPIIQSPFSGRLAVPAPLQFLADGQVVYLRSPLRRTAAGAGYWARPDRRTVVGVTVSTFTQRHTAYDITAANAGFDHTTRLYNLGLAASRDFGGWDGFVAAEVTQMRAPRAVGAVQLSDGLLVSGAVGVRRSEILARGDAVTLTLRSMPNALTGRLELNYLSAQGLGSQVVASETPLAETPGRTVRAEAGYALRRGERWSLGVSAGADLTGDHEYQLMARARFRF